MLRLYEFEKHYKTKYDEIWEYCLLERIDEEFARYKHRKQIVDEYAGESIKKFYCFRKIAIALANALQKSNKKRKPRNDLRHEL
jgi:hypothetical protein